MKVGQTQRGFGVATFHDVNGQECSIQESSAIDFETPDGLDIPGSSYLWLGTDKPVGGRMHLNRSTVKKLCRLMRRWLKTKRLTEGGA